MSSTLAEELLEEVMNAPNSYSYWARKSKLASLENTGDLTPLEFKLLTFDVAMAFKNAGDVARSAEQLFRLDKSDGDVRVRIRSLLSALTESSDAQFASEVMAAIPMEALLEMFFCAFPERNSASGSLYIYISFANNHPRSLSTMAVKLFESYLKAAAEFGRTTGLEQSSPSSLTPFDAVFFHLSEQLIQTGFGDLLPHGIFQVFQILLNNCYEDSIGRISENFYRDGIQHLGGVAPRNCWSTCTKMLAVLLAKANINPKLLEMLHNTNLSMFGLLKQILADADIAVFLKNAEILRLFITFAFAHLYHLQQGPFQQFVCVPANFYWVNPHSLDHHWAYNVDPSDPSDESATAIDSIRVEGRAVESLKILNLLFSSQDTVIDEVQLLALVHSFNLPNVSSLIVFALTACGRYKQAMEFLNKAIDRGVSTDAQKQLLQVQKLQIFMALRDLRSTFQLCLGLYSQWKDFTRSEQTQNFPILVSQEISLVPIESATALLDFILLSFFHVCWLIYVRLGEKGSQQRESLFAFLIVLTQSVWELTGFGLFQQLLDHISRKDTFTCPNLLNFLNNTVLLSQLFSLSHVKMHFGTNSNGEIPISPAELSKALAGGKLILPSDRPISIVERFLGENQTKFIEMLQLTQK